MLFSLQFQCFLVQCWFETCFPIPFLDLFLVVFFGFLFLEVGNIFCVVMDFCLFLDIVVLLSSWFFFRFEFCLFVFPFQETNQKKPGFPRAWKTKMQHTSRKSVYQLAQLCAKLVCQ